MLKLLNLILGDAAHTTVTENIFTVSFGLPSYC